MAYTDFTLSDLEERFGIKNERKQLRFAVKPVQASERLLSEVEESSEMPIKSEGRVDYCAYFERIAP